jgi:hypothetical protein
MPGGVSAIVGVQVIKAKAVTAVATIMRIVDPPQDIIGIAFQDYAFGNVWQGEFDIH